MSRFKNIFFLSFAAVFLLLLAAALIHPEIRCLLMSFISGVQNPFIFFPLMAVLPVLGCPISLFLVPLGARYGLVSGLVVMAVFMPLHLMLIWVLAGSFLRRPMERLLERKKYSIPEIPEDKITPATFLVMAVPGPPYFIKNYMAVLAGIPFSPYFWIGWFVHSVMSAYWVVIGGAVHGMNWGFLALVTVLMAMAYVVVRMIQKRAARMTD